ncbi:hypothetical protein RHS04_09398 [Rhizoctonia solani]|uniref:Uncharacterized protein n=1 Tax=Rhizoctonia solani TaxID=456999 RepID=A0A8H7LIA0_9AGAM|nr:hypothetical protein RHS04_09398 [Rhizoctonia solani]
MNAHEAYPPLPPSPEIPSEPLAPSRTSRAPPYIRTSFSSRYARPQSQSAHTTPSDALPMITSPSAPSLRHHSQSRGHRYSKSINSGDNPPPLPLPSEAIDAGYASNNECSDNRTEAIIRQWRTKRHESDPGLLGKSREKNETSPSLPVSPKSGKPRTQINVLKDNPRIWTPSQLAQYLLTALRFKPNQSSETVPVPKPVAQDIANFVVKYKLNGRVFLRLQDKDIEEMGINQLWRTVLMSSSLELRKSLLKGRIWGFGCDNVEECSDQPTLEHGRRVPSTVLEREETSNRKSASVYSEPAPLYKSQDLNTLRSGGYIPPSSPTLTFNSDASNYIASYRSTRPRAESISSVASSSAGRVREIVQNLERAASSSEDAISGNEDAGFASSEVTSESDEDHESRLDANSRNLSYAIDGPTKNEATHPQLSTPQSNGVSAVDSPVASHTSKTSRTSTSDFIETPSSPSSMDLLAVAQSRELPNLSRKDFSNSMTKNILAEEPTIEALLGEEGNAYEGRPRATSWGAKAWEEEFLGGTSRRVPAIEIPKTSAKPLADIGRTQEMITVPRSVWDTLCRRLDDTERRIALLEMQEAERKGEVELLTGWNFSDDPNIPRAKSPGSFSVVTLSPYLVIVGVGVCALVAEYVFGHMAGRRSRS